MGPYFVDIEGIVDHHSLISVFKTEAKHEAS